MFFSNIFNKKDTPDNSVEQDEILISFEEIFNQVNNISDKYINRNDLMEVFKKNNINQEVINQDELEKLYNKIPNNILKNIETYSTIDPEKGDIAIKYFRVNGDSAEYAAILNTMLNTNFEVNQHSISNGGGTLLLKSMPVQVNKNNLLKLISFKIVNLFDEKNI